MLSCYFGCTLDVMSRSCTCGRHDGQEVDRGAPRAPGPCPNAPCWRRSDPDAAAHRAGAGVERPVPLSALGGRRVSGRRLRGNAKAGTGRCRDAVSETKEWIASADLLQVCEGSECRRGTQCPVQGERIRGAPQRLSLRRPSGLPGSCAIRMCARARLRVAAVGKCVWKW